MNPGVSTLLTFGVYSLMVSLFIISVLYGSLTSPSYRRLVLDVHWKDWCWSWNSNTLATSCKELTHWKIPWWWEGLGAGGLGTTEDEMAGWHHQLDGWVWMNSGSWWWTGRPGVLRFMGSQRVGHDWATELNRTELSLPGNLSVNLGF